MLDRDLISEESCRAGAGMSYQGLIRVQFQGEGLPQEERQFLLDYLGFGFRPGPGGGAGAAGPQGLIDVLASVVLR